MIFLYLTLLIFLDSIQIKVFYESHAMNFKKELGKMKKSLSCLVAAATLSFSAPAFAADSELVVFDWGGYEDEMFFQDYMKKYGDAAKMGIDAKDVNQRRNAPTRKKT